MVRWEKRASGEPSPKVGGFKRRERLLEHPGRTKHAPGRYWKIEDRSKSLPGFFKKKKGGGVGVKNSKKPGRSQSASCIQVLNLHGMMLGRAGESFQSEPKQKKRE